MRPLNTFELLLAWEYHLCHSKAESSIVLLRAAATEEDVDPALVSVAIRDHKLFQLRESMFGSRLFCVSACPACGEKVEWESNLADFKVEVTDENEFNHRQVLRTGSYSVGYRLPNSGDMVQIEPDLPPEENVRKILRLSVLDATKNSGSVEVAELPAGVLQELAEQIEAKISQADIRISLSCPFCNCCRETGFDIQSYLWMEIDGWAKGILNEVYLLARHFGWTEESILGMSPQRRQIYLQMIYS